MYARALPRRISGATERLINDGCQTMNHPDRVSPWYPVQVKPNGSAAARRNISRQSFTRFLPLERETRRQGARFVSRTRPHFPGCMFVEVAPSSAPWCAIRSPQGVERMASFSAHPTPVPFPIIVELLSTCDAEGFTRPQSAVNDEDIVHVTQRSLAGFVGRVERLAPDERAWVLLEIMGKQTRVLARRADLRLAS